MWHTYICLRHTPSYIHIYIYIYLYLWHTYKDAVQEPLHPAAGAPSCVFVCVCCGVCVCVCCVCVCGVCVCRGTHRRRGVESI